jgi:hypothetical protein
MMTGEGGKPGAGESHPPVTTQSSPPDAGLGAGPAGNVKGSNPAAESGDTVRGAGSRRMRGGVRGRATRLRDPASACLNCGDRTPGEYCPTCGQRKTELVSVRAMVMDVLEDEFVINRRLPRTLLSLFFRPGFLTVEHVNGRIARYVRPLKLYIVSSVVFFLLLSFFSFRMLASAGLGGVDVAGAAGQDTVAMAAIDSMLVEIAEAEAETALPAAGRIALERSRGQLEAQRQRTEAARSGLATAEDTLAPTAAAPGQQRRTVAEMLEQIDVEPPALRTRSAALNAAVNRRVASVMEMTPRQAAERLVGDFLNYIPTMMFVLLPFFALVLKLLYARRRRYYAEHFVFLLHGHSFVYLIFTVMLLIRGVVTLPGWLLLTLLTWTLLYLFLSMKRVYGQGWFITFLKASVLGWSYAVLLVLSIPAALLISFLLM